MTTLSSTGVSMNQMMTVVLMLTSGFHALASNQRACGVSPMVERNILLACSFDFGYTTNILVVQEGRRLLLQEQTVDGLELCRRLTPKEWRAQKISLTVNTPKAKAFLLKSDEIWHYAYRSPVFSEAYVANCQRPQ